MHRINYAPLLGIGLGMSLVLGALACGSKAGSPGNDSINSSNGKGAESPLLPEKSALQKQLAELEPARGLPPSDSQKRLSAAVDQYFQRAGTRRLYVHLDKPMYQPGESMWFRIWEMASATLTQETRQHGVTAQLISPKGAQVLMKRINVQNGIATNDFVLPDTVQGGEYTVRVSSDLGGTFDRKVMVSQYQPPRIKKKVEFLRKAYGPRDSVAAAVRLSRATGEPLAKKKATAIVTVDEAEVARFSVKTNDEGAVTVKFDLPARIARGDGLLTLLVEDGGVTESIQKRIPILLKKVSVELFPEGGDLVAGLPGRVYFLAENALGKPADIEGRVVDDTGHTVTGLRSFHNGMGRFDITPDSERRYFVEITKPTGVKHKVPLPAAKTEGCAIQAVDDFLSEKDEVRVGVWCSERQTVMATAVLREKRLGDIAVEVGPKLPSVVSMPVPVGAQGAVRFTIFDEDLVPLAERLVYRGRGSDLDVAIESDRASYAPRDQVELTVKTRDLAGKPVAADLSLAVVDDTVLSFADDKTAHMLARVYLEAEMPGQEVEEPNFYFSDDPKAPQAIDLVLGTQGWRRFAWQQVLIPAVDATSATAGNEDPAVPMAPMAEPVDEAEPMPDMARDKAAERRGPPVARKPMPRKEAKVAQQAARGRGDMRARRVRRRPPPPPAGGAAGDVATGEAMMDEDWAGADREIAANRNQWAWAAVREFPAPTYEGRHDGPRTDFRETIFWAPSVETNKKGEAKVSFYLSDAVTSFRVTAEGASRGGLPGRAETLVQSKLPVSLAVKMPLEVSKGDTVRLPVTLSNETEIPYKAKVTTEFGPAFKVTGGVPKVVDLRGGERKSFFATLKVVGDGKEAADGRARVAIDTARLTDEVERTIRVVPLGFPQEVSAAGTLDKRVKHELDLAGALPGTIEASVTMYPSPLATMVAGTEAIIREPHGCFEQASSANYPNIMVLGYLEEHEAADPALVERTIGMLDRGYQKLTGYESPKKGYEWFGGDPGHEALTAYGLMEFADMNRVYEDVDEGMVARTRKWLMDRRDGKGGYQRNARALDSFGRASEEVTNGYITYALTEAGQTDGLRKEIAYQKSMAEKTSDPYVMALAANTLLNVDRDSAAAKAAVKKLRGMQKKDGSFSGADHSITRSGGAALTIETTALAAMALVKAGEAGTTPVREAIEWLNENRSGFGSFSSTQATILSLKAMTTYASASRATQSGGTAVLYVNGKKAGKVSFEKGHKDQLVFEDVARFLRPGKNTIELRLDAESPLPYSIGVQYRSKQPATSKEAVVRVDTDLAKDKVPLGESVRMKVRVENVTDRGQPMTLARVGIPGGLTFQTWQLKELVDKGAIDFFETREREVVLYFRALAPKAVKKVNLDLLARVPGEYVAPATSAYLYYTDEHKHWTAPTEVTVSK